MKFQKFEPAVLKLLIQSPLGPGLRKYSILPLSNYTLSVSYYIQSPLGGIRKIYATGMKLIEVALPISHCQLRCIRYDIRSDVYNKRNSSSTHIAVTIRSGLRRCLSRDSAVLAVREVRRRVALYHRPHLVMETSKALEFQ